MNWEIDRNSLRLLQFSNRTASFVTETRDAGILQIVTDASVDEARHIRYITGTNQGKECMLMQRARR